MHELPLSEVQYARGTAHGYRRVPVRGCDYPAVLRGGPGDSVRGVLYEVKDTR